MGGEATTRDQLLTRYEPAISASDGFARKGKANPQYICQRAYVFANQQR